MSDADETANHPSGEEGLLRRRVSQLEQRLAELAASHESLETALADQTEQLEDSEAKWRSLAETAVDFIVVLDRRSRIRFLNHAVKGLSPEEVRGREIYDFFPAESHARLRAAIDSVLASNECVTFESPSTTDDGNAVWYNTRVGPFRNRGRVDGTTLYVTDITKRRRAEMELREREDRLRLVVQNLPVMLDAFDADGNIIVWNRECEDVTGYSREDIVNNRQAMQLLYPDPGYRSQVERSALEPGDHYRGRIWICTSKDGTERTVLWTNMSRRFPIPGWHSWAVGIDITEQVAYEQRLGNERETLEQLLDLQESERKLISYEIHDGLLQEVVGAKMFLEGICHKLADDRSDASREAAMARECLARAVAEGRRLINDLRPIVVDDRGLAEAVRALVDDERTKGGLSIGLELQLDTIKRMTPLVEGVVFRIIQEALNNVRRHAQTDQVQVRLGREADTLLVEIRDDGAGFDPERIPSGRFGVEGIRKRAALFDGSAKITSAIGAGTLVSVRLPISKLPQPSAERLASHGEPENEHRTPD